MTEINKIYCKDSVEFSKECDIEVDSIVTDPPYGIDYLNKDWDSYQDCVSFRTETWESVGNVLKPGGHLLIFGASRTFHRLVTAVEDSSLKIKDQLMWLYGQGMPKSHNIGKKLPEWEGWGTGLKPCYEPILLAQKPISEKSIVENVKKHGSQSKYSKGSVTTNFYFSHNGNIPSQELRNTENLSEAYKLISEYSYYIKYVYNKDPLGEIKFVDCSQIQKDDFCFDD